jgi:hypothetical protein
MNDISMPRHTDVLKSAAADFRKQNVLLKSTFANNSITNGFKAPNMARRCSKQQLPRSNSPHYLDPDAIPPSCHMHVKGNFCFWKLNNWAVSGRTRCRNINVLLSPQMTQKLFNNLPLCYWECSSRSNCLDVRLRWFWVCHT